MQMAVLPTGHEAGVWDLKRWRYRLFSIAGKIISSARRKKLLIPRAAPESSLLFTLHDGFTRLHQHWRTGHLAA